MTSDRDLQRERLEVLKADRQWREGEKRGDTLHQRAQTELGQEFQGRFSRLHAEQQIIGSTTIAYPKLPSSSPWSSDPLGPEMPIDATECGDRLNYEIDSAGAEEVHLAEPSDCGDDPMDHQLERSSPQSSSSALSL